MAVMANKRSIMTLYNGIADPYSHRVRIVLAEKGVTYESCDINEDNLPESLSEINPYSSLPTLVDRELVIYPSQIIMEYLDERFPHPPLMPVYPVAKARSRLWLHRVDRDWYNLMDKILKPGDSPDREKARKALRESLISVSPIFESFPFFMSEEFSLVDCAVGPLLWRLQSMGIEIPSQAKALQDYMGRLFERNAFQVSLTDTERALAES